MKIKEYLLVSDNRYSGFIDECNEHIKKGFQPYLGTTATIMPIKYISNGEGLICFSQAFVKYEEENIDSKIERNLIDFSVNWYPTSKSMDRNEKELIDEGWETFKKESLDYNEGLMTHKLMMVKYED